MRRNAVEKMMRIMPKRGAKAHPVFIPWSVAELAYSVYVGKYGRSQTLERIAERGGFYSSEMDEFVPDWRERCDEIAKLKAEIERSRAENAAKVRDLQDEINWLRTLIPPQTLEAVVRQMTEELKADKAAGGE